MDVLNNILFVIGTIIFATLHFACAAHALLHQRVPYAALVWVSVCLLIPLFGPILYIILGFNRITSRVKRLMRRSEKLARPEKISTQLTEMTQAEINLADQLHASLWKIPNIAEHPAEPHSAQNMALPPHAALLSLFPARLRGIAEIAENLTKVPMIFGNSVTPLFNGEEAYPAMLEAINKAQRKVWLTTYIFDNDKSGGKFVDALGAAHERGVDVRVLIDGVGTFTTWPRIDKVLKKHGVKVARFLPPRLLPPQFSINLRNHRKLLLVDSGISFTGGINISDVHLADKPAPSKAEQIKSKFFGAYTAKDIHFQVNGPAVNTLHRVFARDWEFCTGERLTLSDKDVCTELAGKAFCRSILDGPDDYFEVFHSVLLGVLSAAKQSVHIMTPYFLPQLELITAMQSALLRGVDISIIIPGEVDHKFVRWATFNCLQPLLERGVKIYFQPPPFDHSKLLLVDGAYLHMGSANMDPRSFRLNFELTMEVIDLPLAARLEEYFETVRNRSYEYTLDKLNARPLRIRIRDAIFWLMSPYL